MRIAALARLRRGLAPLIGLSLFLVALAGLRRELHAATWHALVHDVFSTPWSSLSLAIVWTVANYAVLTGYDLLAFASIGKQLPRLRIVAASFLASAIANNVGFAMVSGTSVRYRFYTRWGVTAEELSRIVFAYAVTFWSGLLLLGGMSLAVGHLPAAFEFAGSGFLRPAGWFFAGLSVSYVIATFIRRAPLRFGRVEVSVPSPPIAFAQLAVSAFDWTLAAAVLYALLPPGGLSFLDLLGVFVAAQLVGLASNVPGGVGVFESLIVLLLKPSVPSSAVLPALLVYRVVYYLLPLAIALVALVADELHQRRAQAARLSELLGAMTEQLAPRVLALFTFLSGAILLFSGATPAAAGRLAVLHRVLPLGIIEASHFLGSIVGAALLLLSQGLARRLDVAYLVTMAALGVGVVASLLKAADYEEAIALTLVMVAMWRARPAFTRRAAFFDTRFSPGWVVAVVGALSASLWLGSFAYKHLQFSNQLWWQFELHGEASRFLRGSVGAAVLMLLFALARLIAPAPHEIVEPSAADFEAADRIIDRQTSTSPYLVFLRDKGMLFDERREAFVMYGVQGRTWVALGDPVGPPERIAGLIRLFLEKCDDFNGVPVFYEVGREHLHKYADFGLTFVKLGEEARVDLTAFTLDGGGSRRFRQVLRRLEHERTSFRIAHGEEVLRLMERLRAVSDDWLANKAGAEKGFSLGFFKPEYVARFPVAILERDGDVVAFATLWPGPQHAEVSVDLMRYRSDAPEEAMEGLLVHIMVWARRQEYRWFGLGMAPLSGFERSPVAPLWTRLASFVYQHGESFYGFQGLRAYKEKFHPRWEPRYLVFPGGLSLPRILVDVSALIAGGYRQVLLK